MVEDPTRCLAGPSTCPVGGHLTRPVSYHTTWKATRGSLDGPRVGWQPDSTLVDRRMRMEMLTDQTAEVMSDTDHQRDESPFQVINVLSGVYLTLDQLRGVYAAVTHGLPAQVSTSEGTSLMRPCNGSKRVSVVPEGWVGG